MLALVAPGEATYECTINGQTWLGTSEFIKEVYFFQQTKVTSWLGPNDITIGSADTRAGSQSLIALCKSFKWPHFGCLNNPE